MSLRIVLSKCVSIVIKSTPPLAGNKQLILHTFKQSLNESLNLESDSFAGVSCSGDSLFPGFQYAIRKA